MPNFFRQDHNLFVTYILADTSGVYKIIILFLIIDYMSIDL